jgi:lipopolysaccharide biosynthesis glycosyltransferase
MTLATNSKYLPGLITMAYSFEKVKSKYPLVVLITASFPEEGRRALKARNIAMQYVEYVSVEGADFSHDPRFFNGWTKLVAYSLTQYDRVVMMDCDMIVLQNMDELMDIELDPANLEGTGNRVFAASHACVCNPLKLAHYPSDWLPEHCAYTIQAASDTPEKAQTDGAPSTTGAHTLNGGLQVLNPSAKLYADMMAHLLNPASVSKYSFAEQSLLSEEYQGRWVPLPYIYNALKTLRWKGVHDDIWRDDKVKNVHYILAIKPWDEKEGESDDVTHEWWWKEHKERLALEEEKGLPKDGF